MTTIANFRSGPLSNITVATAKGSTLIAADGRKLLDLTSGFGVAAIGYGNEEFNSHIHRQLTATSWGIPSIIQYTYETIVANSLGVFGEDLAMVPTTSGTESIEVALKVAFRATGNSRIVTLSRAFHGQSLAISPLSGQRGFSSAFPVATRDVTVLPTPRPTYLARRSAPNGDDGSADIIHFLEDILLSDILGGSPVAAVIVEPMQNLGGYRLFGEEFGKAVTGLCRRAGALLIADEIFTGSGRTGEWLLANTAGYTPDLICIGKACTGGIPGGACLGSPELMSLLNPSGCSPLHAPTFFGAPITIAALGAATEFIARNDLASRAADIERLLIRGFSSLLDNITYVDELRGHGAAIALVLKDHPADATHASVLALELVETAADRGVVVINSGFPEGNTVHISPPLVITGPEMEFAIEVLVDALIAIDESHGSTI